MPKRTGPVDDLDGQVAQICEQQELCVATALIQLAYGRLPSPNDELSQFPELESDKKNTDVPLEEVSKRAEIKKGKRKVEDNFSLPRAKENKETNKSSRAILVSISSSINYLQQVEAFQSIVNHGRSMGPFPSQNPIADTTVMSRFGQVDPLKLTLGSHNEKTNERDLPKKEKKSSSNKPETGFIPATVHNRISFPIVHLLSSVRAVLIRPHTENYVLWHGRLCWYQGVHNTNLVVINEFSLGIRQIVTLMRFRPMHHSILEMGEQLQDLVKGVLKIFSSKTGPVGALDWNPLTIYEKSNKTWRWVGPIPTDYNPQNDCVKEGIFSQDWGIPRKTVLELVSSFAKLMKENEEALKKISTLPPPPLTMQLRCFEERFKYAKAIKSLSTLRPCSNEIRDYFRMEESLRYQMPERAFRYTALDGKKNAVAPLKRGSGKPSVKGRDHVLLKKDRPRNFTILCLVRDAAARLPSCKGTRADISTLARDSQFINEEANLSGFDDAVFGGLDRLSFEDDPCVRFDWAKQVWVYLHGENEDEDFEYIGSSRSSKKRNRIGQDNQKQKTE